MKKNVKLKPTRNGLVVPKILNRVFPIESFHAHHGIVKVGEKKYSLCAMFKSKKAISNMQLNEILEKYIKLLNNVNVSIQFYFSNYNLDKYNLYQNIGFKIDEDEQASYIILSVRAESIDEASEKLFTEMKKVSETFNVKLLSIEDYINIIYLFYNPNNEVNENLLKDLFLKGIHINDIFSSGDPEFNTSYLKICNSYMKYFYIRELPELITKNFISELFKQDFEISISIHTDVLDNSKVGKVLEEKFFSMKKTLNSEEFIPFEFNLNENEDEKLNEYNERFFNSGVYITTISEEKDLLNKRSDLIMEICKDYNFNLEVITHQTENAFFTTMPIGYDRINIRRIIKIRDLIKLIYI